VIRKKKTARRISKPVKSRVTRAAAPVAPKRRRAPKVEPSDDEPELRSAPELTTKRRRELRADAHALDPLVHVGHGGLSEPVVQAVSRALRDHELIKVRLHEPEDKHAMANEIAEATHSALCGLVGHTVILYRQKPKQKGVSGVARMAIKRNREKRGGRR
jgi:RNA-binding protein